MIDASHLTIYKREAYSYPIDVFFLRKMQKILRNYFFLHLKVSSEVLSFGFKYQMVHVEILFRSPTCMAFVRHQQIRFWYLEHIIFGLFGKKAVHQFLRSRSILGSNSNTIVYLGLVLVQSHVGLSLLHCTYLFGCTTKSTLLAHIDKLYLIKVNNPVHCL